VRALAAAIAALAAIFAACSFSRAALGAMGTAEFARMGAMVIVVTSSADFDATVTVG
jgi:hypothetical protein